MANDTGARLDSIRSRLAIWPPSKKPHLGFPVQGCDRVFGTSDPAVLESAFKRSDEGNTIIDVEGESPAVETRST